MGVSFLNLILEPTNLASLWGHDIPNVVNKRLKTCRDIGALAVRNNEIWQVHQRAYKKYYARVLKKKMTKQEFEVWARKAEQLRNEALENYAFLPEPERQQLVEELTAKLNEE